MDGGPDVTALARRRPDGSWAVQPHVAGAAPTSLALVLLVAGAWWVWSTASPMALFCWLVAAALTDLVLVVKKPDEIALFIDRGRAVATVLSTARVAMVPVFTVHPPLLVSSRGTIVVTTYRGPVTVRFDIIDPQAYVETSGPVLHAALTAFVTEWKPVPDRFGIGGLSVRTSWPMDATAPGVRTRTGVPAIVLLTVAVILTFRVWPCG